MKSHLVQKTPEITSVMEPSEYYHIFIGGYGGTSLFKRKV